MDVQALFGGAVEASYHPPLVILLVHWTAAKQRVFASSSTWVLRGPARSLAIDSLLTVSTGKQGRWLLALMQQHRT